MRTSLMTGGLALSVLLPPTGRAQTGGPTPSPGILAPHHDISSPEIPGLGANAERELARAFRRGGIDAESLRARLELIGAPRGELRTAHLRAHLETRAVLGPAQLARYAELRGLAPPDGGAPQHGH